MAKDPAFLFYTGDFLAGISDLTMEERGQYITLLCLQHQKGHLSQKLISLTTANATADVMAKFRQDPAGLWYNERLDEEIEKRKEHTDKQRQRAVDGWEKRKNKPKSDATANATALPLEDENVNKDENEIEGINVREVCLKILTDFKFNEINHSNKLRKISDFIRGLIASKKIEYFIQQYPAYWKYKNVSSSELQSLDTFINDGWEREVWTEKLIQHGKRQTTASKQQSVSDLKAEAERFLSGNQS